LPPEPGFARREARLRRRRRKRKEGGPWGKHGFPHDQLSPRQPGEKPGEETAAWPANRGLAARLTLYPGAVAGGAGAVAWLPVDGHVQARYRRWTTFVHAFST
jgi:hypothetical protein